MATGGRKNAPQLIHEISAQVGPAQVNLGGGLVGVVPGSSAVLLSAHFVTSVAFDAATLTIALGTAPGGAQVLAAQNVKAAGRIDLPISIAAVGPFLADTPIYWTAALTGGPDTVGACAFWLEYLPGPG